MRNEQLETTRWRASIQNYTKHRQGWASQRRAEDRVELAAELVDAALAEEMSPAQASTAGSSTEKVAILERALNVDGEETATAKPNASAIISSLASQLDLLEKQRVQLQMLLKQAQADD